MERAPDVPPELDALFDTGEPAASASAPGALTPASVTMPASIAGSTSATAAPAGATQAGDASGSRAGRPRRSREQARVTNAKRKGRVKEMMNGLERTRQHVEQLEESVRALEAENHDLRTLLSK